MSEQGSGWWLALGLSLLACGSDDAGAGGSGGAQVGGQGGDGAGGVGGTAGAGGAVGGSGGGGGQEAVAVESVTLPSAGVSARLAFEDAYDNVAAGDWYRDANNETATLAWGESYVMMSLAALFRVSQNPIYLDRLAWHIDGVLAQRDDARGVADYRGVSGACWQDKHYQPNDEPYCYVVHSGMIAYPMAEFARLVAASGLGEELARDGLTFADKASQYTAAAIETVAYHDDQWNDAGYYVFRPDAAFLGYPGADLPLNQSNALGRLLLVLSELTGEAAYLDKATKLAQRFRDQISTGPFGEALWNYWGGSYSAPGEDISHAALNVDFAMLSADYGVVFDAGDRERFAQTFHQRVYVDDHTMSNQLGGGASNDPSYRPQVGRWLRLSTTRAAVYTSVRDLYDLDYAPGGIGSGSLLLAWGLLAEHEPIHCEHFFYTVDWNDPDPASDGDFREATAYGANVLTVPPAYDRSCVLPLEVDIPRATEVQQWDGGAYHVGARWQPSAGPISRLVPYEPRWPFVYYQQGVLFQFADTFVAGDGIRVRESSGAALPQIDSSPPSSGEVGVALSHTLVGSGDGALWWGMSQWPRGARIDPLSGTIEWTPPAPGSYPFTVVLQSDWGMAEQSFQIQID